MKNIIKVVIFLLISTTYLNSCVQKNTKKQKNSPLLKARINSTWTYEGKLLNNKKRIEVKIINKEKTTLIDNKNQTYTKNNEGYKNQYYYWLKFPIKKGTTWVNNTPNLTDVATIESINESFKFGEDEVKNCIKVSYVRGLNNGGRNITIRTFCPKIWLVKMETYYENPEGISTKQSTFELKSFAY